MSTPRFEALLKSGDVQQAREEAELAFRRNPADRRALIALAKLASLDGDAVKAESYLQKAAGGTPADEVDIGLVRASLLMQRGEAGPAQALYSKLTQSQPPRAEAFYGLGFLLAEANDNTAACAALERAVQLEPEGAVYHFQLARVLFALARLKDAFHHLEQSLRLNPGHVPSYLVFAIALQAGGELEAAEDMLRQGLKVAADEPHLLKALSNVLAAKGDFPGAVEAAEALVRVQPDHPSALGNLARFRMAQRNYADALALCRKLSERGQATSLSRSVEAMIYETQEPPDLKAAVAAWRSAMKLDPQDWGAANNLGLLLLTRLEGPDAKKQAKEVLEEAIRRAPEQPEPQLNLALVCAQLEDTARAKELTQGLLARGAALAPELKEQAERLMKQLG
ncbi:tetratricopeptide repeat protein [Stigmatella erecta]|uniref:Tfp pilus assembly protein PilF n=1 Tax=Stigmatella erecta TaxID=83460 RepID=A0A1I0GL15_9BACT|nr:tetratricopeptide repeat protein [Stigmatella erecta]SET70870.1 Tfp pilus assembly protein PilF [Stigmatella erecta]